MLEKDVRTFVEEKTKALLEAETCCAELKETAKAWLASLDGEQEEEMTERYINELKEDIVLVDDLIALAKSPRGEEIFGVAAPMVAKHGEEIKANGAVYCDCPACAIVEEILKTLS